MTLRPGDVLASECKHRIDRDGRRGVRFTRPWFCRSCGKQQASKLVPTGWYTVARHLGLEQQARLGAYCSMNCLAQQVPRLLGIEEETRDPQWKASRYQQVRDR